MGQALQDVQNVLLIAAGGTIAAEPYGEYTPDYVTVTSNVYVIQALRVLAEGHAHMSVVDFSVADSKHITHEILERMAGIIARADEDHVIITHGTDRMAENARKLRKVLRDYYPWVLKRKHIVFTGAMEPISHGLASDGYVNLRDALEVVLHAPRAGLCMVMHGHIYNPQRTVKNFKKRKFFELSEVR